MTTSPILSKRQRARALSEICGDDGVARVEAAKKLAADPPSFSELRALLRHEEREETRHAIAFALSWREGLQSWALLLRLFLDRRESPMVRSQAAEGLGYMLGRKRKGTLGFQAAVRALIAALNDPSPHVRYSSVFALGASCERRLIPALRRKLTDRATPAGFVGTVAAQAKEAIEAIQMNAKRSRPR